MVLAVSAAAAVTLACSAWAILANGTRPTGWWIAGIAATLAVGELPLARIRVGYAQGEAYSVVEIAVLASLVALPAGWTPVLAVAVSVTSLLVGRTKIKVLFNTANAVVGAGLATLVFTALGGQMFPLRPWSAVAVAVAVLVYSAWTQLAVSAVLSAATGVTLREAILPALPLRSLTAVGNIVLGLFFMVEIERVPVDTLVVLPIFGALIVLAYRGYVRALDERDLWQQLEVATKALQQLDEELVLAAAAERAPGLFRVEAAEIEVFGKRRGDVSVSHRHYLGEGEFHYPRAGESPAWYDDGVLVVHRVPDEPYQLASATLPAMAGVSGVLRLWSSQPAPFLRRDERLIGTYAQAVSSALLNARLYREVLEQATLKSFEAEHDALTGLANRALLLRRADEAIAADRRTGRSSALVLLDLDHFKHVNDTLGHAAGDALLRAVGHRLPPLLRSADTVARLGGDEFAVLLRDVESPASAMRRTQALLRTISEPLRVGTLEIAVHASAGIAVHPDDAVDVDTLLQRADVAMYHAKRNRGTASQYDTSLEGNAGFAWLAMGAELRQALDRDELEVFFQPQVDLVTHRVAGFEALVRWQHPQRGLVGPNEFIPVAEQSGLVGELTLRVLDMACEQAASWPEVDGHRPSIAVNLSARSLLDLGLADDIEAVLRKHHLDPARLKLEITETTMLGEVHLVVDVLDRLRALGVQIAVDDFGTGYSSLTFLQRVQVNELKIDRSFVAGMLNFPHDAAIVRATVDLARSFGLLTVAEGVESPAAARQLEELGVDLGQGFWYARPVRPEIAIGMVGVVLPA
ncbi:MAG: diguanylate cyclase [Frankiales bacterium]|nr:diguanylate cyclase [Frankiales bacterium]